MPAARRYHSEMAVLVGAYGGGAHLLVVLVVVLVIVLARPQPACLLWGDGTSKEGVVSAK